MQFNAQSPADAVATYLTQQFGTMVDFADNIGEDLPIETLVDAMNIVNAALGTADTDVDLARNIREATGDSDPKFYMHYEVTAENIDALGRAEDILVYLHEVDTDFYGCDNWMAYIEEGRDAE